MTMKFTSKSSRAAAITAAKKSAAASSNQGAHSITKASIAKVEKALQTANTQHQTFRPKRDAQ